MFSERKAAILFGIDRRCFLRTFKVDLFISFMETFNSTEKKKFLWTCQLSSINRDFLNWNSVITWKSQISNGNEALFF